MSAALKLFTVKRKRQNPEKMTQIFCFLVSPMKSLCHEKLKLWQSHFYPLDIKCEAVTGDNNEVYDFTTIQSLNVLIITPEKWDSLSRRWRDSPEFIQSIKLFMIDEVHLLNEDKRGASLEAIVARMKLYDINNNVRVYIFNFNILLIIKIGFRLKKQIYQKILDL